MSDITKYEAEALVPASIPGPMSADVWDLCERIGKTMADGRVMIPAELHKNAADCTAVAIQAHLWGMNPFAVAQATHFVYGRIGYESKMIVAAIDSARILTERLREEFHGDWGQVIGKFVKKQGQKGEYCAPAWDAKDEDGLGVTVTGTIRGEAEPRSLTLWLKQAGTRFSTLWATMPDQQLLYLAKKTWARRHTPGIILGVYSPDELDEASEKPPMKDVTPKKGATDRVRDLLGTAKATPAPEPEGQPGNVIDVTPAPEPAPEEEDLFLAAIRDSGATQEQWIAYLKAKGQLTGDMTLPETPPAMQERILKDPKKAGAAVLAHAAKQA